MASPSQETPKVVDTPAEVTPKETSAETPVEAPVETPKESPVDTPTETTKDTPVEAPAETTEDTPVDTPAKTPETTVPVDNAKTIPDDSGAEEIIDIEQSSKSLLRQMAGINPSKYPEFTPQPRPDMSNYVYMKTARSRKMVVDQDRMLYNLQTIHSDLDRLDREVTQLQEENRRRRNQRRYFVPHDGATFVQYYPNKYSLWDFDRKDGYLGK